MNIESEHRRTRGGAVQQAFQERFIKEAEKQTGMRRHEWGFMTGVKKSLKLRQTSVAERWLDGCMPRLPHLLKIHKEWGITPNELLGIDEGKPKERKKRKKK